MFSSEFAGLSCTEIHADSSEASTTEGEKTQPLPPNFTRLAINSFS